MGWSSTKGRRTHLDPCPPSSGRVAHVLHPSMPPAPTGSRSNKAVPSSSPPAQHALDWSRRSGVDDLAPLKPADTVLELLDQILTELTFLPSLAQRRKDRLDKLLSTARATALIDSATQGVTPGATTTESGSSPVALPSASLKGLEASLTALTHQALQSFTTQATTVVKASIEAAFKTAPSPPTTVVPPLPPQRPTPPPSPKRIGSSYSPTQRQRYRCRPRSLGSRAQSSRRGSADRVRRGGPGEHCRPWCSQALQR